MSPIPSAMETMFCLLPLAVVVSSSAAAYENVERAPQVCEEFCESVYQFAASCNFTNPMRPATPMYPFGYNETCLCTPHDYMEFAPLCINCLFRNNAEDDFRTHLVDVYGQCIGLGQKACPVSCSAYDAMVDECEAIDEQSSKEASTKTSSATGSVNGSVTPTSSLKGDVTPDTLREGSATLTTSSAAWQNSVGPTTTTALVKKSLTLNKRTHDPKDCICRPDNMDRVQRCFNCMNGYDALKAQDIAGSTQGCLVTPSPSPTSTRTTNDRQTTTSSADFTTASSKEKEQTTTESSTSKPKATESSNKEKDNSSSVRLLDQSTSFLGILAAVFAIFMA